MINHEQKRYRKSNSSRKQRPSRRGAILVWFSITLILLLGMTGLVIDGGFLMSTYRQLHNSVDAAAMAAADDLMDGASTASATATAIDFVKVQNQLPQADVVVNIPPSSGPYAGSPEYVEVIAECEVGTFFIHLLPGARDRYSVSTRAVAGYEAVSATAAITLLDPDARPGLSVTGNARLSATGRIVVNSEGGGVDENGESVDNGNNSIAAFVSRFGAVRAREVAVVGGVNRPAGFVNYVDGDPNPLRANQLPVPDPLTHLPTPTVENGVVDVRRGAPTATREGFALNNAEDDSGDPNYVYVDTQTGEEVMVLRPGIYDSIRVTDGRVEFLPGIYVLAASSDTQRSLAITGGDVTAEGIMFYNTGADYDAITGGPDARDADTPAAGGQSDTFGQMQIDATVGFSPLDTNAHDYPGAPGAISDFDGLLIYQRRSNNARIQIQGLGDADDLRGTVYAKTAQIMLAARGTYNSQFVAGSMRIVGHSDVTIDYPGDDSARAPWVFLVE